MHHNLLINLYQAAKNGNLKKFLQNPQLVHSTMKDLPHEMRKGVEGFVKQAVKDPGGATAQLINGIVNDPELLFLGGVEGGVIRRALIGGAVGGGIGASAEAAGELKQEPKLDLSKIVQSAAGGAVVGGGLSVLGGKGKAPEEKPPEPIPAEEPKTATPPPEVRESPGQFRVWLDNQRQADVSSALDKHAQDILDGNISKTAAEKAMSKSPALVQKLQEVAARRGQARAAFDAEPEAPEDVAKTRLAEAAQIGVRELPPAQTPKVEVPGAPSTLDSAVEKVRIGRRFDMTPEERIAWNASQKATGGVLPGEWYKSKRMTGSFDPEAAGKALGKVAGLATMALGRLIQDEPYTAKTLERLPQGKESFTTQQVEDQLRRPDVTRPEKDAFHTVLQLYGKDGKISSQDLVKGFRLATEQYHLTPEEHAGSASGGYGLKKIDRSEKSGNTTTYHLPEGVDIGRDKHGGALEELGKSNMLGWTRNVTENGIRHVTEVQLNSNLAEPKNSPEVKNALARIDDLTQDIDGLDNHLARAKLLHAKGELPQEDIDYLQNQLELKKAARDLQVEKTKPAFEKAKQFGKNFERRLVQEELARSKGAPVRFATPDTMAKVEGWEDEHDYAYRQLQRTDLTPIQRQRFEEDLTRSRFAPQHQDIYNRYKRDIVPYLKQLGGKEITDEHGHTWIEVEPKAGAKARMYGRADPELLKKLGIAAGGAIAFHYLDPQDKWAAAATGAALGLVGAWAAPYVRDGLRTDMRLRIDKYADDFEAAKNLAAIRLHGLVGNIQKAVPDESRRAAISNWLEDPKVPLSTNELKVAKSVQNFFKTAATELQKHGLLKEARDNYVTHLWDNRVNRGRFGGALRTTTPFTKARTFTTLAEGKAAGLTPLTEDIAQIVHAYGTSVNNAMAGKEFVDTLRGLKATDGKPLIAKVDGAPAGYVPVDLPQFRGSLVHPDIAPSLRMFESPHLGVPFQGLSEAMQAIKRVKVVGSLFHVKTLGEATIGARSLGKILSTPGRLAGFALGRDAMLQDLNNGGLSDVVQDAVKDGVNISLERETPGVEDIGGSFYQGMENVQQWLDQHATPLGKVNKAFTELNHKLDTLTWAHVQTGVKLMLYDEMRERLMKNGVDKATAGKHAANYVNTMFGGLNWRRIAEGARSRFGRDVALSLLHPKARGVTQILLFAPDWTVSTIRQITQAIKRSGGPIAQAKGLFKPTELADLHRQALVRSAMYYLIVGDAVNHFFSGHHIWQNKNPLRIDLGNGLTMQFSKHLTEPLEWFQRPAQTAAGKLSYAVTEPINQLTGKEYIGGPPMQENRAVHAVKGLMPFPADAESPARALSGMAGFPIYGHTQDQARQIQWDRYRREHSADAYRRRFKKRLQELSQ